jgi:hypothetical protein
MATLRHFIHLAAHTTTHDASSEGLDGSHGANSGRTIGRDAVEIVLPEGTVASTYESFWAKNKDLPVSLY